MLCVGFKELQWRDGTCWQSVITFCTSFLQQLSSLHLLMLPKMTFCCYRCGNRNIEQSCLFMLLKWHFWGRNGQQGVACKVQELDRARIDQWSVIKLALCLDLKWLFHVVLSKVANFGFVIDLFIHPVTHLLSLCSAVCFHEFWLPCCTPLCFVTFDLSGSTIL